MTVEIDPVPRDPAHAFLQIHQTDSCFAAGLDAGAVQLQGERRTQRVLSMNRSRRLPERHVPDPVQRHRSYSVGRLDQDQVKEPEELGGVDQDSCHEGSLPRAHAVLCKREVNRVGHLCDQQVHLGIRRLMCKRQCEEGRWEGDGSYERLEAFLACPCVTAPGLPQPEALPTPIPSCPGGQGLLEM